MFDIIRNYNDATILVKFEIIEFDLTIIDSDET